MSHVPTLSVVLPVYDVREYLVDCVRSLQAQELDDLEIVAVDDGSRDGSGELLDELALTEPRMTVIHQENAGLGAARNRAIAAATGELLTFLDPDDLLPPDAYRLLVSSLRRTGSDLAVGGIDRFTTTPDDAWRPGWAQRAHATALEGVTVTEHPEVLDDIVACNRVVRREVWDRVVGRFPEGVVYEDHVPVLRLYLEARAFDVLTETTYLWRRRADDSSLGQRKHELANLRDRVAAKEEGLGAVVAQGDPGVLRCYVARVLGVDLPPFLRGAVGAEDDYWTAVGGFAARFVSFAQADPAAWDRVETHLRTAAWLAAAGARPVLEALFERQARTTKARFPVRTEAGEVVLDLTALDDDLVPGDGTASDASTVPGDAGPTAAPRDLRAAVLAADVPPALLRYPVDQTALRVTVTGVEADEARLLLIARVRVQRLGAVPPGALTATLVGGPVPLPVQVSAPPQEPDAPGDFVTLALDLATVAAAVADGTALHLHVEAAVQGVERTTDVVETALRGRLRGAGMALAPGVTVRRGPGGLAVVA